MGNSPITRAGLWEPHMLDTAQGGCTSIAGYSQSPRGEVPQAPPRRPPVCRRCSTSLIVILAEAGGALNCWSGFALEKTKEERKKETKRKKGRKKERTRTQTKQQRNEKRLETTRNRSNTRRRLVGRTNNTLGPKSGGVGQNEGGMEG